MLRTGIYLLSSSSLGVFYRNTDLAYSTHPVLKWLCLLGLSISLLCFVLTYLRAQSSPVQSSPVPLIQEKAPAA